MDHPGNAIACHHFDSTEIRDKALESLYPQRIATDVPGVYELPDGSEIRVQLLDVIHTDAASVCEGHPHDPSDPRSLMGETQYCDGSCIPQARADSTPQEVA